MRYSDHYTQIYCRLLDDPDFRALSPEAQRTWFYLRLSDEAGPFGLFVFYPELTQARMRVTAAALARSLKELEQGKWIAREGNWLLIRNALRFNPAFAPKRDGKHLRSLHKHLARLARLGLARQLLDAEGLPYPSEWGMGGASEPLARAMEGPAEHDNNDKNKYEDINTVLGVDPDTQNVREVVEDFNRILGGKLNKVAELSQARIRTTRARLRESKHGAEDLRAYFESVLKCPFLLGANKDGWAATFDWLMAPSNMAKVKDGNYRRKGSPQRPTSTRDYSRVGQKVEVDG